MRIFYAFIVPCDLATRGIDSTDARGNLLILTPRSFMCQTTRSIARTAVFRALSTVLCEAAFIVSTHRGRLARVDAHIAVIIDFFRQGEPENQLGDNAHIHHIDRCVAIAIRKRRVLTDATWVLSLVRCLPQRDQYRALHIHDCGNRILVDVSRRGQARGLNWSGYSHPNAYNPTDREHMSAPELQRVHLFPHIDSPINGVNLSQDAPESTLLARFFSSSSAGYSVHYW